MQGIQALTVHTLPNNGLKARSGQTTTLVKYGKSFPLTRAAEQEPFSAGRTAC